MVLNKLTLMEGGQRKHIAEKELVKGQVRSDIPESTGWGIHMTWPLPAPALRT